MIYFQLIKNTLYLIPSIDIVDPEFDRGDTLVGKLKWTILRQGSWLLKYNTNYLKSFWSLYRFLLGVIASPSRFFLKMVNKYLKETGLETF